MRGRYHVVEASGVQLGRISYSWRRSRVVARFDSTTQAIRFAESLRSDVVRVEDSYSESDDIVWDKQPYMVRGRDERGRRRYLLKTKDLDEAIATARLHGPDARVLNENENEVVWEGPL